MTMTLQPVEEFRPSRFPGVRVLYNPEVRRVRYLRECGRCPRERLVRKPDSHRNLCYDCWRALTPQERARWTA